MGPSRVIASVEKIRDFAAGEHRTISILRAMLAQICARRWCLLGREVNPSPFGKEVTPNEKRSVRASSSFPRACSRDIHAAVPTTAAGLALCKLPGFIIHSSAARNYFCLGEYFVSVSTKGWPAFVVGTFPFRIASFFVPFA